MDSQDRIRLKQLIKEELASQPIIIADSARYFADRLLELKGKTVTEEQIALLGIDSILRAIRDSGFSNDAAMATLPEIVEEYGETISRLAVYMVTYMTQRKAFPWKPGAIAAGLGVAAATILGG